MANNIALITKYMQNAVDTVLAAESKTKILENGSKFIDVNFQEAGYVKVMSLLMDGLSDYYRVNNSLTADDYSHYQNGSADGYKVGAVEASWELFKLEYDRGKQFQVDAMDDEESAGLVIGNLLTEFLRTKVVPEIDIVRFSKIAAKTSVSLGNRVSGAIAENKIIEEFNKAYEWLTEHEVPEEDQVIFVNPSVMTLLRTTSELNKFLTQVDYRSGDISFTVPAYNGRPIIEVPTNRFYTDVVVGANGYYPSTASKVINFLICSKKVVVPIVKVNKSKVWTPEQVQDFDGYKVNFRIYHDVIIPKNKLAGVYVSVGSVAAETKTNKLAVDLKKTTNGYKMTEYFTQPAGISGKVVNSATAMTLGATITVNESTVKTVTKDTEFAKFGSETAQYFAVVDGKGQVLAVSGSVTLPTASDY